MVDAKHLGGSRGAGRGRSPGRIRRRYQLGTGGVVYIGITLLALAPTIPATLGLKLTGIQVEAILVSLLLFFGVQGAWILMVEPVRNPGADRDDDRDGRG